MLSFLIVTIFGFVSLERERKSKLRFMLFDPPEYNNGLDLVWIRFELGLFLVWKGLSFHLHLTSIYMPYIFIDIGLIYGRYMIDIWMLYDKPFQTKTKPLPYLYQTKNEERLK